MTQVQRLCAFGVAALTAIFSNGMAIQAGDQGSHSSQPAQRTAPAADTAAAPAVAHMPEISSLPADAPPPIISIGQTRDLVTSLFGQTVRVAKLGVKPSFYDKDMKVTFTNGKVSNVK